MSDGWAQTHVTSTQNTKRQLENYADYPWMSVRHRTRVARCWDWPQANTSRS